MKEYIFSRPDEAEDTVKRDANYRGELIRCKDCKHYTKFPFGSFCIKSLETVKTTDYCSKAEPKEK